VELDQGGTSGAEAAIVLGQAGETEALAGGKSAETCLAVVRPGKDGGGVKGTLVGGAVAGGFTATSLELIDGAFDELTKREEEVECALIVGEERLKRQAQATGAIVRSGHVASFMLYTIKT
jgi:hypothetical protein